MHKEIIEDCTLYRGNCFEALEEIRDADCVITDPPYALTDNEWDELIDLDLFWELIHKAAKINAAYCIFCQMPFAGELYASNKKNFKHDIVYVKPKLTGFLNAKKMPLREHESIYVFYRKMPTYNPQMGTGKPYVKKRSKESSNYRHAERKTEYYSEGWRYPTSILNVDHDLCFYTCGYKPFPQHPTQKSVAALSVLAKTYTNKGQIILDPFMGSGSTGVAAVKTGRKFIGIEQDEKWFEVACRRIEQAYSDRSLLQFAKKELTKKPELATLL